MLSTSTTHIKIFVMSPRPLSTSGIGTRTVSPTAHLENFTLDNLSFLKVKFQNFLLLYTFLFKLVILLTISFSLLQCAALDCCSWLTSSLSSCCSSRFASCLSGYFLQVVDETDMKFFVRLQIYPLQIIFRQAHFCNWSKQLEKMTFWYHHDRHDFLSTKWIVTFQTSACYVPCHAC